MARCLRIQFENAWYHVMHRGANHQKIFYHDFLRLHFLELLDEVYQVYNLEVHAYCLMGNHYHLMVRTPDANLSNAMRFLNSRYTQYFNHCMERDGALFRGRYKSIVVSEEEYLLRLSSYIHLNPAKANLCEDLINYQWSSYPAYLNQVSNLPSLKKDVVLARFNSLGYSGSYQYFVEHETDSELSKFYEEKKYQPALGSKSFCESLLKRLDKKSLSPDVSGSRSLINKPDIKIIMNTVDKHFKKSSDRVFSRNIAMLLARLEGYSLREISTHFEELSLSSISQILCRTRRSKEILAHLKELRLKPSIVRIAQKNA